MKDKKLKKDVKGYSKDSSLDDEQMYLENEWEEEKVLAARDARRKRKVSSVTLDTEILKYFILLSAESEFDYQTLINNVLRNFMEEKLTLKEWGDKGDDDLILDKDKTCRKGSR